jgi:hypothetical protein
MMKLTGLTSAVIAIGLCYSSAALAQDQVWLKDRRYSEGMGIRTGDLELHPGIGAEFGYDSNYFLVADGESVAGVATPGPVPALRLRIVPSFSLSTISQQRREADGGSPEPPKVGFRAGVAASYNEYIATRSGDSDVLSKQRNIGALGNLQLTILPGRPWGADLFTDFLRSVQPSENPEFNFNRITARFGGGIVWAPGGGMFDWRVGYEYGLTYFEQPEFRNLSTNYNQINTRGRWRFLPRTAFLYDATATFLRYNLNPSAGSLASDPIRARIGLNGLVTPAFSLLAMVGWGSSFYQGATAQQFDGPIAQAELRWYITPNPGLDPAGATLTLSSLALGYVRDFANSYLGDFYTSDRGYLSLSYFFGGRFLLVGDAGIAAIKYPLIYSSDRTVAINAPFTTLRPNATLFGEYRVADSVGINATLRYTANITDVVINTDQLKWNRFEGFVGVRWFL